MKNVLKYTRANVRVSDEFGQTLFEDHNLFTDSGRAFIAGILLGTIAYNQTFFACDFGSDGTTPTAEQDDLVTYISSPEASVYVTSGYPIAMPGYATGVHFQFSYTSANPLGDTIRELGLFYRPDSDVYPAIGRGSVPATMKGTMIARLKTTLSSINVSSGRTITVDWKILF